MVYLYLNTNDIKLIYLKKTLLGQQETSFFEKHYESGFLKDGAVVNVDLLASAIKEALTSAPDKMVADNQLFLILPQQSFYFLRTSVPSDIAPSAMNSFIIDKARSQFPVSPDDCLTLTFIRESGNEKIVNFFGINKDTFESYRQAAALIDLRIQSVIPETLAFFKLFEKTLRAEKKENIFYLTLDKDEGSGYLFDSFGLLDEKATAVTLPENGNIETAVKNQVEEFKNKNIKLNRIILSGEPSDKIRQDTFTKAVGVWTNPLKRIVPTFYEDYLKQLVVEGKKSFPLLSFDSCFGAFIFASENREGALLKAGRSNAPKRSFGFPKLNIPKREIFLFAASFALSFLMFLFFSKIRLPDFKKSLIAVSSTPTPAPTFTPTPTLSFKKETLKIKILNGGGVKGKANEVKEILVKKGYSEIITDNADNFDYTKTEIRAKKSVEQAVALMQADLKDYVSAVQKTPLSETDTTADLVITIGSDFE